MNWNEIVRTLGTVLIGSGAIVWLLKSLWSQFLARDIETFRANLENRNSVEIERLKGELNRISFEHETRYARIYEKRAEALEELFKRMVKANRAFANKYRAFRFVGDPPPEEQTKQAGDAANDFIDWFTENRLFRVLTAKIVLDMPREEFKRWFRDPTWGKQFKQSIEDLKIPKTNYTNRRTA